MGWIGTVTGFNHSKMKNIIFLFLLLASAARAQYAASFVDYAIDSISTDSFYLRTRTITPVAGQPHKDTTIQYQLFTDTSDFINLVADKYAEILTFRTRYQYLKDERDTLAARYNRLVALGGTAESPFRAVQLPPELMKKKAPPKEPEPTKGFWVIAPGKKPEFMTAENEVTGPATILHPDGRKTEVKKTRKTKQ